MLPVALLVGDAVNTICVLEMECVAQDQAGRVRVAAAEDKAAAAKVELESLQRAVVQEQKQAKASLQRHERDVQLEVSRKIRQAESRAQAEELKLQNAERALSSAKLELESLRRKVAANAAYAQTLVTGAEQRVQQAMEVSSAMVEKVRNDSHGRCLAAEEFAKKEEPRIAASTEEDE